MNNQTAAQKVNSRLGIVMAKGESVILEVSKHPVGAAISLIVGLLVATSVVITGTVLFGLIRQNTSELSAAYGPIVLLVSSVLALVVAVATVINIYLYQQNRLIITTEKVAQIHYKTIIDRKVIQLSIERIQDVTVSQIGVLPRIFHYGTVIIDTAGEQEDCVFSFAPNPYELSREIMDLHEKAVAKYQVDL